MIKTEPISQGFIEAICSQLKENKRVRRTLPSGGRLNIDRQLPFLCIYRRLDESSTPLTEKLIMGEASYLIATGNRKQQKQLSILVKAIARIMKEVFGSFMIVEIWLSQENKSFEEFSPYKPVFKILKANNSTASSSIGSLEKNLKEIYIRKEQASASIVTATKITPPDLPSLISLVDARKIGVHIIGIGLRPVYRNSLTNEDFPLIHRDFQRRFARALKYCFFDFTHNHTSQRPLHYLALGRRSMVKAVWEADRQLADICSSFDFLLQVTPIDSQKAWLSFQRNKYQKTPVFEYRPLPIDPAQAKRKLYQVPIERMEDPTLVQLFRGQQLELDRKFTMLIDRGTPRFKYGSLQLYGGIEDSLLKLSKQILQKYSPRSRDESASISIDATAFAARANKEMDYFRKSIPEFRNNVQIREDISGLMVSQGNLLIGSRIKFPTERMEALIQHEVGTHVLTHINGKAQPLRQLYVGLAGYDELQEGLAVLSEYLVGGLTGTRLRLLAARVVAAHLLIDGASFVEVYQELNKNYGFERRTSFTITKRTFRSGGLTKDAIYLRGLVKLLEYIKNGGTLAPLFVGKISASHISVIKELQWRKVLKEPPLIPRYMNYPETQDKLNELKNGLDILNLINRRKK
ncbi:MAG: flavohemoglobin expression-modulating QEGLA motif protein [Bacteroidales bacterium]|nr:flavohemoglobin expression-modulating QEGLA motif protein [Bacteroidales bacterium]MCF8390165.1 flavohemoglobin expression-modulating QEGLA motif protein [Bacteroidales bacterium]